jgi:hypothetical protein
MQLAEFSAETQSPVHAKAWCMLHCKKAGTGLAKRSSVGEYACCFFFHPQGVI